MKSLFQQFIQWLLGMLKQDIVFATFAQGVLWLADLLFVNIVQVIGNLVKDEQVDIDHLKDTGATEAEVKAQKLAAAERVDIAASTEFSGSPTYVPGMVRRAVRDAWAYIVNHATDPRNEIARDHKFFRSMSDEELKEIVEKGLNTGFTGFGKK